MNIEQSIRQLEHNKITRLEKEYAYLSSLNMEQKIAATQMQGNYLVLAGPGSGKTQTLMFRAVHLIYQGVDPQKVCIVTFTKKAGEELKKRLSYVLPDVKIGFVGTFHALANSLLQQMGGLHKYRLIDAEDDYLLLKLAIEENEIELKKGIKPNVLMKVISYSRNTCMSIEQALINLNYEQYVGQHKEFEKVANSYKLHKKQNGYLNYDDILEIVAHATGELKKAMKANYEYLMIDEYQDTNKLQLDFVKSLNIPNIMAIGDDFQSIYGFRGADHKIILNFYADYPNAKLIVLDKNYRSTPQIVEAINATIVGAKGYHKILHSTKSTGEAVEVLNGNQDKGRDIIRRIQQNPEATHAVVYRYSKCKNEIENMFLKVGIEYAVYGGKKLLERKHVKDVLALLLASQNRNDIISYMRVLTLLQGVGEVRARKIIEGEHIKDAKVRQKIESLEKILSTENDNLTQLLYIFIKYYLSLPNITKDVSDKEIKSDFETLLTLANKYTSISAFISDVVIDSSHDVTNVGKDGIKVILTTIHSSKGLEFDNVYFIHRTNDYTYDRNLLEEERRLFYVGISRAREKLIIYDESKATRSFKDVLRDFSTDKKIIQDDMMMDLSEETVLRKSSDKKTALSALIVVITVLFLFLIAILLLLRI